MRVTYCAELNKHLAIVHLQEWGWGLAEPEGREGKNFHLLSPATARNLLLLASALSFLLPLVFLWVYGREGVSEGS